MGWGRAGEGRRRGFSLHRARRQAETPENRRRADGGGQAEARERVSVGFAGAQMKGARKRREERHQQKMPGHWDTIRLILTVVLCVRQDNNGPPAATGGDAPAARTRDGVARHDRPRRRSEQGLAVIPHAGTTHSIVDESRCSYESRLFHLLPRSDSTHRFLAICTPKQDVDERDVQTERPPQIAHKVEKGVDCRAVPAEGARQSRGRRRRRCTWQRIAIAPRDDVAWELVRKARAQDITVMSGGLIVRPRNMGMHGDGAGEGWPDADGNGPAPDTSTARFVSVSLCKVYEEIGAAESAGRLDESGSPKTRRRRRRQQEPSRNELRRRRELAAITRIHDPIEQCLAHIAKPRYKDFRGELYTVFRVQRRFCEELQLEIDELEIKSGYSIDTLRHQFEYRDNCAGVDFIWCYKYTCDSVKLLERTERLVHLTLRKRGAAIAPYPCPGCGVNHREFYLDSAAGGIEGICEIIEFWLGALGQKVDKGCGPTNGTGALCKCGVNKFREYRRGAGTGQGYETLIFRDESRAKIISKNRNAAESSLVEDAADEQRIFGG
ncbi:hypothetical protein B0H19DRAFT_1075156 [Mycena capillaripes]|nr:hypothetical protein B0H19DRAFT_1075156 [Mycena capillaripes]